MPVAHALGHSQLTVSAISWHWLLPFIVLHTHDDHYVAKLATGIDYGVRPQC